MEGESTITKGITSASTSGPISRVICKPGEAVATAAAPVSASVGQAAQRIIAAATNRWSTPARSGRFHGTSVRAADDQCQSGGRYVWYSGGGGGSGSAEIISAARLSTNR